MVYSARSEVQKPFVVLEGPAVTEGKPKFANSMNDDEDLGEDITVKGENFHY